MVDILLGAFAGLAVVYFGYNFFVKRMYTNGGITEATLMNNKVLARKVPAVIFFAAFAVLGTTMLISEAKHARSGKPDHTVTTPSMGK